jgi:hypothetical protein
MIIFNLKKRKDSQNYNGIPEVVIGGSSKNMTFEHKT